MITQQQIEKLASSYFAGKPVLKAYLFGSFARGEQNESSDIDVLVELDYAANGGSWDNWCEMQDDLELLLQKKVDLVSANGLSKFIAPFIHKDRLIIYDSGRSATA